MENRGIKLNEYIKPAIQTRHDDEDDEDDEDEIPVQYPKTPERLLSDLSIYNKQDLPSFKYASSQKEWLSQDSMSHLLLNYNKDVDIKTIGQLTKHLSDLYEDIKINHNITIIEDFDKEFNLLSTIIDNINDYILNNFSSKKRDIMHQIYLNIRLFINNLILIICFYINNEHNLCIKPKINIKEEDIYRYFMNGYNIGLLSK